ncbi:MAG TPA: TPM domain-containing protein [Luteolibacter sp.]|nr:TPM domain-containing protein [Luteolibacter sp.]
MKHFLNTDEEQVVVDAIRTAESRTSAEIRVCVSYRMWIRVGPYARRVFRRMGMDATRGRNGVLILVLPRLRRFRIVADDGVAADIGPDFWKRVARAMEGKLREGLRAEALATGISLLENELSERWPAGEGDCDELPNEIARD